MVGGSAKSSDQESLFEILYPGPHIFECISKTTVYFIPVYYLSRVVCYDTTRYDVCTESEQFMFRSVLCLSYQYNSTSSSFAQIPKLHMNKTKERPLEELASPRHMKWLKRVQFMCPPCQYLGYHRPCDSDGVTQGHRLHSCSRCMPADRVFAPKLPENNIGRVCWMSALHILHHFYRDLKSRTVAEEQSGPCTHPFFSSSSHFATVAV